MTLDSTDKKMRWGGLLENPYISKVQRCLLDGFRVNGLYKALVPYSYNSVLDVGCGLGECSAIKKGTYFGLDNSFKRLKFAARRYPGSYFLSGDALQLPFRADSFDAVMLINTSHHLSDEQFCQGLLEMRRVSTRYIVISDAVILENQSKLSSFFYGLDRGGCYRKVEEMQAIFNSVDGIILKHEFSFVTFPGIYSHVSFILEIQ